MHKASITHHGVEYGYELAAVIPFAYWHSLNGTLGETHSCVDTKWLYYFSEDHYEDIGRRHSGNLKKCLKDNLIPNIKLHLREFDYSRWTPPPYKEVYENDRWDFDVVVTNKYNVEWKEAPVNYYSPQALDAIFESLKGHNVLYNHMTADMGRDDTVDSLELCEWDVVDKHPHVTKVQDVVSSELSFNLAQLEIYANCKLFVTVQGGSSIFASYFGGTNIIYAVKGQELKFDSFNKWYHKLGGSKIVHCTEYNEVLKQIQIHDKV